jgi:hypothetical protein
MAKKVLEINNEAKASTKYLRAARTRSLKAEVSYLNKNKESKYIKPLKGEDLFHKKLQYYFSWNAEREEWTL